MKKLINIITPAFNEEEGLDELAKRIKRVTNKIKKYRFEIIIIENGSVDNSFEKLLSLHAKDKRFKILQMSRNFGCDGAIAAGLKFAKGEAAILMNADLQDPPETIPQFIKKWEEGYEIVYGLIKEREKDMPLLRKVISSLFYKILYHLTHKAIPKNASDFRLIDKKVYRVVNTMEEKNKFLRGIIAWTGFKQIGVPFKRAPRFAGKAKANFSTIVLVALNGIFSFSYLPLKIATFLGFFVSLISFFMIIIELFLYLIYGRVVPGFTTIMVAIFFLFGILFLILGIMGEYVARIYDEVKGRPNFIIKNKVGLN